MARNGIFFAMEEGENLNPVSVSDAQLEVEQSVSEGVEQNGEIDDMTAAVEEAVEGAEQLESIQEVAEQSVETGEGLPPEAAQVAEIAVEAIFMRLGMRNKQKVVPSMESFGSKNSRVAATKIAIESITEKAKSIWEAIKKTIANVIQKIKDFIFKMLNNVEKFETLAKDMKREVSKVQGSAEAADFENEGLAAGVGLNADSFRKTAEAQIKLIAQTRDSIKNHNDGIKELREAMKDPKTVNGDFVPDDETAKVEGVYGGKTATYFVANGKAGFEVDGKEPTKGKMSTLSTGEMNNVLGEVVKMAEAFKSMKESQKLLDAIKDSVASVADVVIAAAKRVSNEKEISEGIAKARTYVTSASTAVSYGSNFTTISTMRTCKAGTDYVRASMKQYKA